MNWEAVGGDQSTVGELAHQELPHIVFTHSLPIPGLLIIPSRRGLGHFFRVFTASFFHDLGEFSDIGKKSLRQTVAACPDMPQRLGQPQPQGFRLLGCLLSSVAFYPLHKRVGECAQVILPENLAEQMLQRRRIDVLFEDLLPKVVREQY
jgi:hypothetical protein